MTINANESYTLADYARVAKIGVRQAWNRAKAGKIPGAERKHGGGWRVPGTALLAFTPTGKAQLPSKNRKSAYERALAAV